MDVLKQLAARLAFLIAFALLLSLIAGSLMAFWDFAGPTWRYRAVAYGFMWLSLLGGCFLGVEASRARAVSQPLVVAIGLVAAVAGFGLWSAARIAPELGRYETRFLYPALFIMGLVWTFVSNAKAASKG